MAIGFVYDIIDRRFYFHDLGSRPNLSRGNPDARRKNQLQSDGKVVHDEGVIASFHSDDLTAF